MDGEYKTLNNGDKADKYLSEKNRELTSERDEAVMKVTRLYIAKEALECEVKKLSGGAGAYRVPVQAQHQHFSVSAAAAPVYGARAGYLAPRSEPVPVRVEY